MSVRQLARARRQRRAALVDRVLFVAEVLRYLCLYLVGLAFLAQLGLFWIPIPW